MSIKQGKVLSNLITSEKRATTPGAAVFTNAELLHAADLSNDLVIAHIRCRQRRMAKNSQPALWSCVADPASCLGTLYAGEAICYFHDWGQLADLSCGPVTFVT